MKVILLKDVAKIGRKYDLKDVASGHALNLLIPQGLAISATTESVKRMSTLRAAEEGERKVHQDLLVKNIGDLDGTTITVKGKANEKGHLFAGLHKESLVDEIAKQTELQIDPAFLQIEHPLKEVGEHMITATGGGKSAKFKVVIEAVK